MKTAQLPPVRVSPEVREQIERALADGESLSQFIEKAAMEAATARLSQQAFLERGRASLEKAKRTGRLYPATQVLDEMRERLAAQAQASRKKAIPKL